MKLHGNSKKALTEMQSSLDGFNSRLYMAEERVNELDDRSKEIAQFEEKEKNDKESFKKP
jgi:hypothetical protein